MANAEAEQEPPKKLLVEENMNKRSHRHGGRAMETNGEGTNFQEGDHVRITRTQEIGRVHAADGGVVYVLLDGTNKSKVFSASVDEDAFIELVTEAAGIISQEPEREVAVKDRAE